MFPLFFSFFLVLSADVNYVMAKVIRVKLAETNSFQIEAKGLTLNKKQVFKNHRSISVSCKDGIKINSYSVKQQHILLGSQVKEIRFNQLPYRGELKIIAKKSTCLVINYVQIDDYLSATIGGEMGLNWPVEALKAQAVAARTYVLYQSRQFRDREYDVDNSVNDQVYLGSKMVSETTKRAVGATKNLVLKFGSSLLKAYYHSNCGGATTTPEQVWGKKEPGFVSVRCPKHSKVKNRWKHEIKSEQLKHIVAKIDHSSVNDGGLHNSGIGLIAGLASGVKDAHARLKTLVIHDRKGKSHHVLANRFRLAVGGLKIKSTKFQMHTHPGRIAFEGEGFGHGVGLCQYGTKHMAEFGARFQEILAKYYPLARLHFEKL